MKLSHSGSHSGWKDYSGSQWDERKPIDWIPDWPFWKDCVERFTTKEQTVLEVACGNGRITRQIAMLGYKMVAVDINASFLSRAQSNIPDEFQHNIDFVLADVVHLDLDHQFPLIVMTDWAFPSLLTVSDMRQFFEKISQHLLPNGVFVFDTIWATTRQDGLMYQDGVWQWGDGRRFDPLTQVETRASGQYELQFSAYDITRN